MFSDINIIEKILLNAIPAKKTILSDDWIIRMNDGYTYRSNCVFPFNYSNTLNVEQKIKYCEKIKTVNVMVCPLTNDYKQNPQYIKTKEKADNEWLDASAKLSGVSREFFHIHCERIKNIALDSIFVSAVKDNKIVGCGYGTIENNYIGIYDLHVDSKYRKQGIGNAICNTILSFGKENGIDYGYLIVHSLNKNAINIYKNKGFKKVYEYNFYEKPYKNYSITD